MSPRLTVKILAAASLCAATTLVLAGCGGGDEPLTVATPPPASAPIAATTLIAQCVNAEDDVIVGGPNAKKGCDDVVMETDIVNAPKFDEILVTGDGVLTINPGPAPNSSAQAASARQSVPLAPIYRSMREICIKDGGVTRIGTKTAPIADTNKVYISFQGNRDSSTTNNVCPEDFSKGIDVMAGGSLLIYGVKGVPARGGVSWTTLAAPAGSRVPGAKVKSSGLTTLKLSADVTQGQEGWEPDDWIVVATTDYDPFHSEFVQIASVKSGGKNGGSTVTLREPLKYYHFGSLPPSPADQSCPNPLHKTFSSAPATQPAFLCDGAERNWGVDERAEVGLISRDIELTASTEPVTAVPPPATSSVHWGGEIAIHQGFKQVVIQGARLSKFGKDRLGSYPIHFHMAGTIGQGANPTDQSALIDADSIDHSYNHCVTIHSTSNLTISNLVCARIVGHIFYEELMGEKENNPADDSDIVFDHDLGIGAMSHSFDIYAGPDAYGNELTRQQMIDQYWWTGDYMTNADCDTYKTCIHYDGFNIPDTDNWLQTVHGACAQPPTEGFYHGYQMPNAKSTTAACPPDPATFPAQQKWTTYVEPSSGFWIQNPGTTLTNDAIAGCQGDGVAYWWVAPGSQKVTLNGAKVTMNLYPFGKVEGVRASGCYWGYADSSELHIYGNALLDPRVDGKAGNGSLVATLNDITATHTRARGVWLRDKWFAITNSHFANNNRSVTLVTSGGIEGNAPGVWELLENSVLVGESQNNVGRWGPCATKQSVNPGGTTNPGWTYGCIDYSYPRTGVAHSGDMKDFGYPEPTRNAFGYMIYDGPVRIFHDRFVNYNDNKDWTEDMPCSGPGAGAFYLELDDADCAALQHFERIRKNPHNEGPPAPYEGDAALGWFDSNQNAYPVTTATKQLMWVNTNFRHQIYTDKVGVDTFNDGDKNTAIIDEDGTLDGLGVKLAPHAGSAVQHAISLNNLPFNSTSNSVDECLSGGAQNHLYEGRDSSLMSPVAMAQLEFADLFPYKLQPSGLYSVPPGDPNSHWQYMTFFRTDAVPNGQGGTFRPSMTIEHARNGQGQYEPKVANGYGYYVMVAKNPDPLNAQNPHKAGFWHWLEIGVVDADDRNISKKHPYYIRLGINYKSTNQDGNTIQNPPPNASYFTIERGYKTYGNGTIAVNNPFNDDKQNTIFNYWTDWSSHPPLPDGTPVNCYTMDALHYNNVPWQGNNFVASCPGHDDSHPLITLQAVSSVNDLMTKNSDGSYTPRLDAYYYNPATGYLWLNIVQQQPNPIAPAPIASCDPKVAGNNIDPSCPDTAHGESYYACPKAGCIIYTIAVKSDSTYTYTPGPSTGRPSPAVLAALQPPASQNQLVVYGTNTVVTRDEHLDKANVPFYTAANAPACHVTEPDTQ